MHVYFSGIGGVGLGPLAEIAKGCGHTISGSDQEASPTFLRLKQEGVDVSLDQSSAFMAQTHAQTPIGWFVYTAALPNDHPELVFAKDHGIKTSKRDELLKEIINGSSQKLVAIAGTHGKTTTTGMVVWLFKRLNLPISYSIGAPMSWASSGAYDPASDYFIYECDEFDRNFLKFTPFLSLITSISYDHADTYPDKKSYDEAFKQFQSQSQQVIRWDKVDPNLIKMPGKHNRSNGAVAVMAVAQLTGETQDKLVRLLEAFPGTSRRFEKLADNLYSDYAHHPDEIAATLELANELSDNIVVVYQPHQNSRQYYLDYANCFDMAEKIYWLPTYLSREDPALPVLTPEQLTEKLGSKKIIITQLSPELVSQIHKEIRSKKIVIIMGAGSIDAWARKQLT